MHGVMAKKAEGIGFSTWSAWCILRQPRGYVSYSVLSHRGHVDSHHALQPANEVAYIDLFALQCHAWKPSFRRTPCPLRLVAEPYGADATTLSDLAAQSCPLSQFLSEVARDVWIAGWVSRRWHDSDSDPGAMPKRARAFYLARYQQCQAFRRFNPFENSAILQVSRAEAEAYTVFLTWKNVSHLTTNTASRKIVTLLLAELEKWGQYHRELKTFSFHTSSKIRAPICLSFAVTQITALSHCDSLNYHSSFRNTKDSSISNTIGIV